MESLKGWLMTRRLKLGMAAFGLSVSLASGGAVVASTAQAQPAAEIGPASLDCLSVEVDDQGWTDYITITNHCSYTVTAKVVLDNAVDKCIDVPSSGYRGYINYPARFNRLDYC
jgi:hypothetical protein